MAKATLQEIETKVANLEPFNGNSMRGQWETDTDGMRMFVVYSYATVIANAFDISITGRVIGCVGSEWHSQTTSRHQNIVRRAWGVSMA